MKKVLLCIGLFSVLLMLGYAKPKTKSVTNVLVFKTAYSGEVVVRGVGTLLPEAAVLIGNMRVEDRSYQQAMLEVSKLAAGMGGNMVVVTKHHEPHDNGQEWTTSPNHRIWADVYLVEPQNNTNNQ